MPYGYYEFVRFAAMLVFAYLGYLSLKESKEGYTFIYIGLALLFQPFFKVALGRFIWNIVDVVVSVFLIYTIVQDKNNLKAPNK
jgi:hypothetical protein